MARRKIIPYRPYLKAYARKLRRNMTRSEVLLWTQLKGKQMLGYDFDRQRPIDNYIVDFYCKDLQLAIEIDGSSHHFKQEADRCRQEQLEALGVHILRFEHSEVLRNLDLVLQCIENWIVSYEKENPPLFPLPGGDLQQD